MREDVVYGIVVPNVKNGATHEVVVQPTLSHRLTYLVMPTRLVEKMKDFSLRVAREVVVLDRFDGARPGEPAAGKGRVKFLPHSTTIVHAGWDVAISFLGEVDCDESDGITLFGEKIPEESFGEPPPGRVVTEALLDELDDRDAMGEWAALGKTLSKGGKGA